MSALRPVRTKLAALGVFVLGCDACLPAQAHHSAPTSYFLDQKIAIEGTVIQFLLRNPHSFIHVAVPDNQGVIQEWSVEWGPGILLAHDNINSETLKPGDKVRITGSPGRIAAEHRLRMSAIERTSDHWGWKGAFDCS
jgi:hypothetical protein